MPDRPLVRRDGLGRLTRRAVLVAGAYLALAPIVPVRASLIEWTPIRHGEFVRAFREVSRPSVYLEVHDMLLSTARECITDSGGWTVPSPIYGEMYVRDSFWVAMSLANIDLSASIVDLFRTEVRRNVDGRCPTFLRHGEIRPPEAQRVDESTLMFVLHCYLLARLGGQVDVASLSHAYQHISTHVRDGFYVTLGEERYTREGERGCFHYWADTYRPAGRPEPRPEVFGYNQGLAAVAMSCLERMRVPNVDPTQVRQVESAYATMVSPADYLSLPQRSGSSVTDVSTLAGEALSLYWFDRSLLGRQRVAATLHSLSRAYHDDGSFLGFKVIANPDGSHRPDDEFIVPISNPPGYYHNGGSWLLYDALALYAGGRHGLGDAQLLFADRLQSEVRYEAKSHEYLSTSPDQLGRGEARRAGYGWNAFVAKLFSA